MQPLFPCLFCFVFFLLPIHDLCCTVIIIQRQEIQRGKIHCCYLRASVGIGMAILPLEGIYPQIKRAKLLFKSKTNNLPLICNSIFQTGRQCFYILRVIPSKWKLHLKSAFILISKFDGKMQPEGIEGQFYPLQVYFLRICAL